ncbi:class II histone deacetylase [Jannaschia rubra]|uniref:Histone deacetylase-like amidohydrolase n=1 Tax=Jannaschia rubra TaxID=282197 RepID=A0A0M6XUG8_9RHOB|nr:class II histone deacetylase [Jannaschia rubra]CTQ33855.1 Histone deacetylase-like amidohydrolase [Jannaschia rubra]SFG10934.1 Acetoin utilization deacetylase AcuC [Jannaschia rubra]
MATGFFHDERCLWHGGGNYAQMAPVGGLVQPIAGGGGLPEEPETKRRLVNLMRVTGLMGELDVRSAAPLTREDLLRVHPAAYLDEFARLSEAGGGELGPRAPFGPGGYDIAALSAGLVADAVEAVLGGDLDNAYALSRPPGHHALPDRPNGFCLLANIALAIRRAQARGLARRFAVLDWDVHHGNGTEAIFLDDPDVLTVSLHQERNYPLDTGGFEVRGPAGTNLNVPLPPGCGHATYLEAMERLALPRLRAFAPDALIVACGFDAATPDPLGRMMATAGTFTAMTRQVMDLAADVCGGRLILAHEGGYSEVYVPFCGHGVIATLAGSRTQAPDPFAETFARRQPGAEFEGFASARIAAMAEALQ